MKLLFVIDYQNDFVSGALSTPGAAFLDEGIAALVCKYGTGHVYYTIDCHGDEFAKSREAKYIPVHCKSGSWGCELYGDTKKALADTQAKAIKKAAFAPKDLDLPADTDEIELCGLLTDMCVLSTAVVLAAKYPDAKIIINSRLCLGSTPNAHKNALAIMRGLNMEII